MIQDLENLKYELNNQLDYLMGSPSKGADDMEGQYTLQIVDIIEEILKIEFKNNIGSSSDSTKELQELVKIRCRLDSLNRNFEGSQRLKTKLERVLEIVNARLKEYHKRDTQGFQNLKQSIWSDEKGRYSVKSGSNSSTSFRRSPRGSKIRESIVIDEFLKKSQQSPKMLKTPNNPNTNLHPKSPLNYYNLAKSHSKPLNPLNSSLYSPSLSSHHEEQKHPPSSPPLNPDLTPLDPNPTPINPELHIDLPPPSPQPRLTFESPDAIKSEKSS